jgi:hypothetical protein
MGTETGRVCWSDEFDGSVESAQFAAPLCGCLASELAESHAGVTCPECRAIILCAVEESGEETSESVVVLAAWKATRTQVIAEAGRCDLLPRPGEHLAPGLAVAIADLQQRRDMLSTLEQDVERGTIALSIAEVRAARAQVETLLAEIELQAFEAQSA